MSAVIVLPMGDVPLKPTPEPRAPCPKKGDWVGWRIDGDFGEVTGVISGQAVAIRWISTNRIEVYSLFSGAMERIVVLGVEEVAHEPTNPAKVMTPPPARFLLEHLSIPFGAAFLKRGVICAFNTR